MRSLGITGSLLAIAPCVFGSTFVAAPALAQESSTTAYFHGKAARNAIPQVLEDEEQRFYRSVFAAIRTEDWDAFTQLMDQRENGPLHQVALAEFYTHANSPRVGAEEIAEWFELGTHLPQAAQLSRLGERRGFDDTPDLPRTNRMVRQRSVPKRLRPRPTADGTMPESVASAILQHIRDDDPDGARQLLDGIDATLSGDARAEWRQRVAWSYFIENRDREALAMARLVSAGSGPWVAEGEWVAGLASWRLGDCAFAATSFSRSASVADNIELRSAAHYWAHRALVRCRKPGEADKQLRAASGYAKTLYGMLAREQLGQAQVGSADIADFSRDDWQKVQRIPNARIAAALMEIDEEDLAGEVLRHQASIGDPDDYSAIARMARHFGLPQTQLWLATSVPSGAQPEAALQFPVARWAPSNGWRVDPALAFAHALQESNFRTSAVSPASARGLMQITPITVRQHAGRLNMNASYVNLNDPQVNLAFGQENLEMLRDSSGTRGQLPKIMAAYNAGLAPVIRWNSEVRDQGDPLLYMEAIPYWETRGYVAIVMRNYWMYEQQADVSASPSRTALAQNQWPGFPKAPSRRR